MKLKLTIQIVNFEKEGYFLVLALAGELVHGLDELRQGHGAAPVLVKYPECPLNKKLLKYQFYLQGFQILKSVVDFDRGKFSTCVERQLIWFVLDVT